MMHIKYSFCRICEALCGLKVTVDNNKIIKIEADKEHVATCGAFCVKGTKQHKIYDSPDRLRGPMKREGNSYVRISWEQAYAEIGARVKAIRSEHGPDSISMYIGTAAGFSMIHPVFAQGFMTGIGSRSMYAPHTQDCANKFAVAREMYGFPYLQPFPDVDRTDFLLIAGGNPAISKFSFLQLPNAVKRFKDIVRRGGRVIFIDPRKNETARAVGEHIFIRPNSDVFFYLSFLNELEKQSGIDHARVDAYMKGLEPVLDLSRQWPAEKTAELTSIEAETLRDLVASYIQAKSAALYCSTGVNMGPAGSLAFWLQEVINAVSGNLDRFGGTLVGKGIVDFPKVSKKQGALLSDIKSRIGGFPPVSDCYPGGLLPDEIMTPGEGQLRALFVSGGNPLNTMANSERLKAAFNDLDLLVSIDIFLNETASQADYVLPPPSFFEMSDILFIFPLLCGLQMVPYMQVTGPVVAPDGDQKNTLYIYLELARASGVNIFGSALAQNIFNMSMWLEKRGGIFKKLALSPERIFSLILRAGGQGSFKKLMKKYPHGRLRPPQEENSFLGKRVLTDDGRVDLAPGNFIQNATLLEDEFARQLEEKGKLRLITRRHVQTHNSWMHNIDDFATGKRETNYLYMHPDDALSRGINEGDFADVSSETGKVRLPVEFLPELMPGVVALPHGWGHQPAKGLSVASRTKGVNVNLLAADGPDKIEKISGMTHLTGIIVEVTPAAGKHDPSEWSGIPEEEAVYERR